MMNWTLSDVDEYGCEFDCSACKQHVRAGVFLPDVCPHCKERTRRKYARGPHIKSLDRMENSPRVFYIDRIMTDGWFGCMQFRTVKQLIKAGRFYEAIPIVEVPKKWRE